MWPRYSDKSRTRLALMAILCTFFVDNVAWSIVYPVFAPFFLDPHNQIFSPEITLATRTMILGGYLSIFPLAQFFFAPLIGEFSDRNGRRSAFLYTIFLTFLGFLFSAIGMQTKRLWLLFLGRGVTGAFSGNLSICLAAIADLSKKRDSRLQNFGYLAFVAGTAFVLGAYLGGKLSDTSLYPYFFLALPFWVGTIMTLVNYFFVLLFFQESFAHQPEVVFHFWEGCNNIKRALEQENLKTLYFIYFLFLFSWNIVLQFSPVLAVNHFTFSTSDLGDFIAFLGICWAFGSGALTTQLLKITTNHMLLCYCLLFFSFCSFLVFFTTSPKLFVLFVGLAVTSSAVAWPVCTEMISAKAEEKSQGKVLGISQSLQSLAMSLAPFTAIFAYISLHTPFVIGAIISAFGFFVFVQKK